MALSPGGGGGPSPEPGRLAIGPPLFAPLRGMPTTAEHGFGVGVSEVFSR